MKESMKNLVESSRNVLNGSISSLNDRFTASFIGEKMKDFDDFLLDDMGNTLQSEEQTQSTDHTTLTSPSKCRYTTEAIQIGNNGGVFHESLSSIYSSDSEPEYCSDVDAEEDSELPYHQSGVLEQLFSTKQAKPKTRGTQYEQKKIREELQVLMAVSNNDDDIPIINDIDTTKQSTKPRGSRERSREGRKDHIATSSTNQHSANTRLSRRSRGRSRGGRDDDDDLTINSRERKRLSPAGNVSQSDEMKKKLLLRKKKSKRSVSMDVPVSRGRSRGNGNKDDDHRRKSTTKDDISPNLVHCFRLGGLPSNRPKSTTSRRQQKSASFSLLPRKKKSVSPSRPSSTSLFGEEDSIGSSKQSLLSLPPPSNTRSEDEDSFSPPGIGERTTNKQSHPLCRNNLYRAKCKQRTNVDFKLAGDATKKIQERRTRYARAGSQKGLDVRNFDDVDFSLKSQAQRVDKVCFATTELEDQKRIMQPIEVSLGEETSRNSLSPMWGRNFQSDFVTHTANSSTRTSVRNSKSRRRHNDKKIRARASASHSPSKRVLEARDPRMNHSSHGQADSNLQATMNNPTGQSLVGRMGRSNRSLTDAEEYWTSKKATMRSTMKRSEMDIDALVIKKYQSRRKGSYSMNGNSDKEETRNSVTGSCRHTGTGAHGGRFRRSQSLEETAKQQSLLTASIDNSSNQKQRKSRIRGSESDLLVVELRREYKMNGLSKMNSTWELKS